MFELPPPCGSRLQGARVVVVVPDPSRALAIGAALAHAGAVVDVARTLAGALSILGKSGNRCEAALVDVELGRDVQHVVEAIRAQPYPCFHVVVGEPKRLGGMKAAFASGAIEIVLPPLSAQELVEAVVRAVDATSVVRARCDCPAPWAADTGPRHGAPLRARQGIEGAIERIADRLGLSVRERDVLRYLALGYRYADIGLELSISARTVKWHVTNLRRKLGASSRAELLGVLFAA